MSYEALICCKSSFGVTKNARHHSEKLTVGNFAKFSIALTVAGMQINGAWSANDIVQHVNGPKKNAELLIAYALKEADKLLGHFVDPAKPKRILTDAEFGTVGAIRACYQIAVIHDELFFAVDRAESEADQSQTAEAETVKSLKASKEEIKKISHTFCGFGNETDVSIGKISDSLVVRLVKVRNALRRASNVTFTFKDTSTQNTPIYWADLGLKSMAIVRSNVVNPDGTPRIKFANATSHLKLSYHLAHSMIIVTAIQLTRNQQNKIAGRQDDETCKQMISDLSDLVTEPGQAYVYGTNTAPGVVQARLTPELTKAVDVAIKAFNEVKDRCTFKNSSEKSF